MPEPTISSTSPLLLKANKIMKEFQHCMTVVWQSFIVINKYEAVKAKCIWFMER